MQGSLLHLIYQSTPQKYIHFLLLNSFCIENVSFIDRSFNIVRVLICFINTFWDAFIATAAWQLFILSGGKSKLPLCPPLFCVVSALLSFMASFHSSSWAVTCWCDVNLSVTGSVFKPSGVEMQREVKPHTHQAERETYTCITEQKESNRTAENFTQGRNEWEFLLSLGTIAAHVNTALEKHFTTFTAVELDTVSLWISGQIYQLHCLFSSETCLFAKRVCKRLWNPCEKSCGDFYFLLENTLLYQKHMCANCVQRCRQKKKKKF